jgi:pimeloyl-ACP methyl ester carboxylesterase
MNSLNSYNHATVPTEFVEAEGIRYAYRRFGKQGQKTLLLLGYLSSNMDAWDPTVTNGLAENNEIILFDNAGVGASGGTCRSTVAEMAKDCAAFCSALGLTHLHILGHSLGGMIAQQLAQDYPELVRGLILLGTGPRGGEGMSFTNIRPEEQEADPIAFLLAAFFAPTESSQCAGRAHVARLALRTQDRDFPASASTTRTQIDALQEWGAVPSTGRYAMLRNIPHPTLIIHGNKDIVVEPINALILAEQLPNAQLIVYPDASHGAQDQHAHRFLKHVGLFLAEQP